MENSKSLNPVYIFPCHVTDMIFQHSTCSELKSLTETHWTFNEYVENSKLMKKMALCISNQTLASVEEVLTNSSRRYQSLKISQFSQNIARLFEKLEFHFASLTSVTLTKTDFENIDDFLLLMCYVSETIEHVHMDQVYVRNISKATTRCELSFPRLKTLISKCCHASIYHEAFSNCRNLTHFVIKAGNQISSTALSAIMKILECNEKMTILGIHFNIFNLLFSENFSSRIKFRLKEFHAQDIYKVAGEQSEMRKNLNCFLQSQTSLESLTIDNWMGVEIFQQIFHMTCLKNLTLKGYHFSVPMIDWNEIPLHQNESIVNLNLTDISGNEVLLHKIINAAVNLKELTLYFANEEIINFINTHCIHLRSFVVEKCA